MKTLQMFILIIIVLLFSNILSAQVSVNINFGSPGASRYYYLQDIEAYYDNQTSMYIYFYGGRWIHARLLPPSYGHYDIHNRHKVIIRNYRGNHPYKYYKSHRNQYPKGRYNNSEKSNSSKDQKKYARDHKNYDKKYKNDRNRNYNDNKRDGKNNKGSSRGNGNSKSNGRGNGNGSGNMR